MSEEKSETEFEKEFEKLSEIMAQHQNIEEPLVETASNNELLEAVLIAEDQALEAQQNQSQEVLDFNLNPEDELDQSEMQSCIEALLFIADKPLSIEKLHTLLGPSYDQSLFQLAMQSLCERYQQVHHGIELVSVAGGYQFRTKPGRASLAQKLTKVQTQKLSGGAMETLAIIAYKQPLMKEEVDKIRGVDSSYFVRALLTRKLIQISGRSELPGRPILYSTTSEFLEVFGLKDLNSLPSLRELEQMVPASQTSHPEDADPRVREMRRMVSEMKADQSALHYNPKEDEKILKEIREKVNAIPTSTPYLDEMKNAEILAQQQMELNTSSAEPALDPELPA
jgi:segregation and condensation protein B